MIGAALKSEKLNHVVVSSDDEDILRIAKSYPELISLKRPAEISQDHSKAIEYVEHVLEELESKNISCHTIVILQPTSPFTLPKDIDGTIDLLEKTNADSAVSVMEVEHAIHPIKMKTLDGNRLTPFLEKENGRMAAHELPKIYVRNCSVYATKISSIKRGEIIGEDCRGYIMPFERSIDINSPLDFEFAEFLFQKYHSSTAVA